MRCQTLGQPGSPAVLCFHALGVNGRSNERFGRYLADDHLVVMPTISAFCPGETYLGKADEIRQLDAILDELGVGDISLVVASSIGADVAMAWLAHTGREIGRVFVDGGAFQQIGGIARKAMAPILYKTIEGVARSGGASLRKFFWCDDPEIVPYFVEACAALDRGSMDNMMRDMLVRGPRPAIAPELQSRMVLEFGSLEDHFKFRPCVMRDWPGASFPVFEGHDHMQYQIQDPEGFARMLRHVEETGRVPDDLPFLRK